MLLLTAVIFLPERLTALTWELLSQVTPYQLQISEEEESTQFERKPNGSLTEALKDNRSSSSCAPWDASRLIIIITMTKHVNVRYDFVKLVLAMSESLDFSINYLSDPKLLTGQSVNTYISVPI